MNEEQRATSNRIDAALERIVRTAEERRERAAGHLKGHSGRKWYFSILGLRMRLAAFDFELDSTVVARLKKVEEHPSEEELAQALQEPHLASAVSRYSRSISHELEVDRDRWEEDSGSVTFAWWLISALRVRTQAELLVPCVVSYPWSAIAAVTKGSCEARVLEDVPGAVRVAKPVLVKKTELEWVRDNVFGLRELQSNPAFGVAVEALCTYHHQASQWMMAALLWAGLEAMFDMRSELRFRLATNISAVLEPRGDERLQLYLRVKQLYNLRSRIVHGSAVKDGEIVAHVLEVRDLLSRLLCKAVEDGQLVNEAAIEKLVFE